MAWLSKYEPYLLSVLRIVAGLLFLEHGTQKLFHFPPPIMTIPPNLVAILMTAAVIELVGGVLITLGLFTRIAAFIASGEMAFAYFLGHASARQPLPGGERRRRRGSLLLHLPLHRRRWLRSPRAQPVRPKSDARQGRRVLS